MKRRIHVEEYNPDDASSVQSSTGMAGTLEQLEGVGSIGTDGSGDTRDKRNRPATAKPSDGASRDGQRELVTVAPPKLGKQRPMTSIPSKRTAAGDGGKPKLSRPQTCKAGMRPGSLAGTAVLGESGKRLGVRTGAWQLMQSPQNENQPGT